MNISVKQNQTHRHREQSSGYQWGEGSREGQDRGRRLRAATKIHRTAQGMKPVFCNNYNWSIIFKNCESLCCTAKT